MSRFGDTSRLKEAWEALSERAEPQGDCPEPEKLLEAVRGTLPPEETRELVAHFSGCPACAEAWRLARELEAGTGSGERQPAPRESGGRRRMLWAAAAGVVLLVAVIHQLWVRSGTSPTPVYRDEVPTTIRSLVPEDEPLPREDFLLRWSPGPAGSLYEVEVTTASLVVVASAPDLEEPSYQVPPSALADLPAAARLYWRVETTLPDGSRVASQTFLAQLK